MPLLTAVIAALAVLQGPAGDIPAKYRIPAPAPSTVVARVNGIEIRASDVEDLLWQWRGFDALQDLITYETVRAEAAKVNIDVPQKQTEDEIDAYLNQVKSQLPQGKTLDDALLEGGFTRSRLYLRFRTEDLVGKMVERSFEPTKMVKVSTMVFRPKDEQTTALTEAIKNADSSYASLKGGKKWDDIFKTTTTDPNALKTNGLIGWRSLDVFPPSVQKELSTLKPGEFTKPAQTENGIQIFRLEVAGKSATPAEQAEMKSIYMSASRRPLLDRLRNLSKIERLYPPAPKALLQNDRN